MRLIDADKLYEQYISRMNELIKCVGDENKYTYESAEAISLLCGTVLIKEAPTVGGWISVNDRMPEDETMVIGYTPVDGYMFVGFHRTYVSADYCWSAWYIVTSMRSTKKITKKVTHWMPLPEPPKEEDDDRQGEGYQRI